MLLTTLIRTTALPNQATSAIDHLQMMGEKGGEVLPKTDSDGNPITYKEYDVDPYTPGVNRGKERVVIGGGSSYYTGDHYKTFKPIK